MQGIYVERGAGGIPGKILKRSRPVLKIVYFASLCGEKRIYLLLLFNVGET